MDLDIGTICLVLVKVSARTFIEKFVLESKEFLDSVKLKEEFISKIYRFIFGRDTDKQGKQYWLDYIDGRIFILL